MIVRYTPSLREQIRGVRIAAQVARQRPVVIRSHGVMVERVDAVTRRGTGEPQQFRWVEGVLRPLPRAEWIVDPVIVDVAGTHFR